MLLRESAGECGAERSGAAGAVGRSPTKPPREGRRLRAAGTAAGRDRRRKRTENRRYGHLAKERGVWYHRMAENHSTNAKGDSRMAKELTAGELAERSLITKYRKTIWNRLIGGCKDYELIQPNDRIAVCISGGKDSMLLAKCMQHLQKYSDFPFEVEYLVMDPGYSPPNRELIEQNARTLELPIRIFESPIFGVVDEVEGGSPCYLCARMRRGYLYKEAQALGCNKIALGHHFNDVIETTLMSMLYGAEIKTMLPKLHSTNFAGMELIRPLYLVREEDIISWGQYNHLRFLQCACCFTERTESHEEDSARREMKQLIAEMKRHNKNVDINIFRSMHNVNLATAVGYRLGDDDELHSFLEKYNEKGKM